MALTYVAIASVTVGAGGASSIDFTNIPQTYTDLAIYISARSSGADPNIMIRFNSSSSNFTQKRVTGDGTNITSGGTYGEWSAWASASTDTASTFGNSLVYVANYTTGLNKSLYSSGASENNGTTAYATLGTEFWSNTAAITSVSFIMGSNYNFVQHSTATLYGISSTV